MSKGILWAIPQQPIDIQPLYPNGEPHHITLQYGVEREPVSWMIGQEFEAIIWEHCWNDRVQALRVHVPTIFPCCNAHPHITVSWVDGAEPVESNTMLSDTLSHSQPWQPNEAVPCRIEFHDWVDEPIAQVTTRGGQADEP